MVCPTKWSASATSGVGDSPCDTYVLYIDRMRLKLKRAHRVCPGRRFSGLHHSNGLFPGARTLPFGVNKRGGRHGRGMARWHYHHPPGFRQVMVRLRARSPGGEDVGPASGVPPISSLSGIVFSPRAPPKRARCKTPLKSKLSVPTGALSGIAASAATEKRSVKSGARTERSPTSGSPG